MQKKSAINCSIAIHLSQTLFFTFAPLNFVFEKIRLVYHQEILDHIFLFAFAVFGDCDCD